MCINKRVVVGLVVAGLAIYLAAPQLIGVALPFLIVAICPLSMIVMMRSMSKGDSACSTGGVKGSEADIDRELASLRADVARLRAEKHVTDTPAERG